MRLAHAYRDQFHKDVLIDLVDIAVGVIMKGMNQLLRSRKCMRSSVLIQRFARFMPASWIAKGLCHCEKLMTMVKDAFAVLEQAKRDADSGMDMVEEITRRTLWFCI